MVNNILAFRNQEFNEPGIPPPPSAVIIPVLTVTTLTVTGATSVQTLSATAITATSLTATGLVSAGDLQSPTAEISGLATVGSLSSTGSVSTTGALHGGTFSVGAANPFTVDGSGNVNAHDLASPTAEISGLATVGSLSSGPISGTTGTFTSPVTVPSSGAGVTNGNGWTSVSTYSNGWSGTAAYRLFPDGTVRLRGLITPGTTTDGTQVFTLPAGVRPTDSDEFLCSVSGGAFWCKITPGSGGSVLFFNGAGTVTGNNVSLENISFSTV